jgi:hypothetical protein
MNIGKLKLAFATLVISSIILSCKKEKNNDGGCSITMSSLSGTYKLTSLKYKVNGTTAEQDFLAFMDDCEKDDLIILNQNGNYNYQDAGSVCSPDNSSSGEWALHGRTIASDGVMNGAISSFDCKTLVYHMDDIYTEGDRMEFVMTRQ